MKNKDTLLAKQLLDYSTKVKKGETVYIEIKGSDALNLGKQLIKGCAQRGATPFWFYNDESLLRQWLTHADTDQMQRQRDLHLELMKKSDVYIGVRGSENPFDLSDIPKEVKSNYNKIYMTPVHFEQRVNHTRWVVLRYPNDAMAQLAEKPTEAFADYYYQVCLANYAAMDLAQDALKGLMDATDKVEIKGHGTDLSFSIKDIPSIKCSGQCNIPDGEVFTAPVRNSVNGQITFNAPSLYEGTVFTNVYLEFKEGKIIKCSADQYQDKLEAIFNTDEGARYVGEFAIGVNPFIRTPMKDILFDEKIAGSFHFTPGQCYDDAPNGNKSAIHWDLVCIQRDDYCAPNRGGEIYFDGKLIRKDGRFTDEKLEYGFSEENLKAVEE